MKHKCDFKKRIWVMFGLGLIFTTSPSGRPLIGKEKLAFSLPDAFGRQVHSQDYKGVPVFLEFGACW
ncbi:MAG: hypothetical protein ACYS0I_14540 [Planctomycetota bacterium]|jgi:hypothetical protein